MAGPLKRASEEYEEELEEFAETPTASQEWLEGMRNWARQVLSGSKAEGGEQEEETGGGEADMGEGAEEFSRFTQSDSSDQFDPLGRIADMFGGVEGVAKQDVCESLYNDIAEIGKRSAVHQDLANLLEDADRPELASDVRDVAGQEKDIAQSLLRVASKLDCDVPTDLKNAVNQL